MAFLLLIAAVCVRIVTLLFYTAQYQSYNAYILVDAVQSLLALVSLIASLSLPRRPSVSEGNHVVDDQYTVSAFSAYTFSFAGKVLSLARNRKSLDLVDLPKLHLWGRSSYLVHYFGSTATKNDRLWKSLVRAHWPELLFQTAWSTLQSILMFAPQLAMYQLLKLLEQRSQGSPVDHKAWGLVLALGISIMLASVSTNPGYSYPEWGLYRIAQTCL